MTNYRRNFLSGGSFFFTVNLAERRRRDNSYAPIAAQDSARRAVLFNKLIPNDKIVIIKHAFSHCAMQHLA
jgi:hypothetical protein